MKDIENRIQEEYDKVEVPEYMFDTSRTFNRLEKEKRSSKKKIISIAASIIVIILVAVALVFTIPKLLREEERNSNEEKVISRIEGVINVNNNISYIEYYNINVASIKIDKINEYIIQDNIPYTKIEAEVLSCYYGMINDKIEIYVPGGVFSVKDIKEHVNYNRIDDISEYKDKDMVLINYCNFIKIAQAEEGKTYITTLNEIDGKYFVNMNAKYGFKEYDPETNIVKDDMGDEQLDIERYLESINI